MIDLIKEAHRIIFTYPISGPPALQRKLQTTMHTLLQVAQKLELGELQIASPEAEDKVESTEVQPKQKRTRKKNARTSTRDPAPNDDGAGDGS